MNKMSEDIINEFNRVELLLKARSLEKINSNEFWEKITNEIRKFGICLEDVLVIDFLAGYCITYPLEDFFNKKEALNRDDEVSITCSNYEIDIKDESKNGSMEELEILEHELSWKMGSFKFGYIKNRDLVIIDSMRDILIEITEEVYKEKYKIKSSIV